jgi:hypothetical protein
MFNLEKHLYKYFIAIYTMPKELIIAIAIGLGLSASCGFRVFVPLVVAVTLILLITFFILKFGKRLLRRR